MNEEQKAKKKERMRLWRMRNRERLAVYNRKWNQENTEYYRVRELEHPGRRVEFYRLLRKSGNAALRERDRRSAKAQKLKFPEKVKARDLVNKAVKSGKLLRSKSCSNCGKIGERIEGHHHKGYENALSVLWLCVNCHKALHRAQGATHG